MGPILCCAKATWLHSSIYYKQPMFKVLIENYEKKSGAGNKSDSDDTTKQPEILVKTVPRWHM